jgi:hypothetical protein
MSSRNLFNIVLKLIGIFMIRDLLVLLAQTLPYALNISSQSYYQSGAMTLYLVSSAAVALAQYGLAWFLVFKTELLITKLKLDSGFLEEFSFFKRAEEQQAMDMKTILNFAIAGVSVYIFLTQVPAFINLMLKETNEYITIQRAISGVEMVVAYIILKVRVQIVDLILKKKPDPAAIEPEDTQATDAPDGA